MLDRFLDIKNPLAMFISYPIGGITSTAVKMGIDAKKGLLDLKGKKKERLEDIR